MAWKVDMFKRRGKYSQAEITQQVKDLKSLQEQRQNAESWNDTDELNRYTNLIEMAQLVLERMYEKQ